MIIYIIMTGFLNTPFDTTTTTTTTKTTTTTTTSTTTAAAAADDDYQEGDTKLNAQSCPK